VDERKEKKKSVGVRGVGRRGRGEIGRARIVGKAQGGQRQKDTGQGGGQTLVAVSTGQEKNRKRRGTISNNATVRGTACPTQDGIMDGGAMRTKKTPKKRSEPGRKKQLDKKQGARQGAPGKGGLSGHDHCQRRYQGKTKPERTGKRKGASSGGPPNREDLGGS